MGFFSLDPRGLWKVTMDEETKKRVAELFSHYSKLELDRELYGVSYERVTLQKDGKLKRERFDPTTICFINNQPEKV